MKKYVEKNLMNAQYIDDEGCFYDHREKIKVLYMQMVNRYVGKKRIMTSSKISFIRIKEQHIFADRNNLVLEKTKHFYSYIPV